MPPPYMSIPSPEDWQRDSYVTLAIRNNDTTLRRIDNLIQQYYHNEGNSEAARFRRQCLACDLYFTVDYWLKTYRTNFHMASGRADTVNALYQCVVDRLCGADMFGCTVNLLPNYLEAMFGRSFTDAAVQVDAVDGAAEYMSRAMAQKSKLVIRNGLIHGYRWVEGGEGNLVVPTNQLIRLNSVDLANQAVHPDTIPGFERYAFFVMSMSRDLYMRQHYSATLKPVPYAPGSLNPGIYHSSYLGMSPVSFAGSMLVENGVLMSIRQDSGHFKPIDSNYVALLWALQMHGISIEEVAVYDYTGRYWCYARDFLSMNGDWVSLTRDMVTTAVHGASVLAPQSVRDAAAAAAAQRAAAAAPAAAGAAAAPPGAAPAPGAAAVPGAAPLPGAAGPRYRLARDDGAPHAYDRLEPDDGAPSVYDAYQAVVQQRRRSGARGPYDVYIKRGS